MFTGIVELMGKIKNLQSEMDNLSLTIEAPFTSELRINQSVAHNGACLTVTDITNTTYTVVAVKETLQKTNLGSLRVGDSINLERCMKACDRFDGHIVQGHVDTTAVCKNILNSAGSWKFEFECESGNKQETVPKGSVCVNGVSLTIVDSSWNSFSVVIIPYTFHHTNFQYIKRGDSINIEFDIIGKYIAALVGKQQNQKS